MSKPGERLMDRAPTGDPIDDRATDVLRALRTPPRLEAARSRRLDQAVARMAAKGRRPWRWTPVTVPALVLILLIVAMPAIRRRSQEGVQARGSGHHQSEQKAPELLIYRMEAGGQATPLADTLGRSQELAFAYRSDGSDKHLMVFARDERGHIYWYHPAWTDPAQDPAAVPLAREPGVHELPAAISHSFQDNRIEICALFMHDIRHVRETEMELARGTLAAECRKVTVTP
jgi:hypothetical protein